MKTIAIVFFTLAILGLPRLTAQELDCVVTLANTEQLTSQARDNISDFAEQVRQYLNTQKYTKEDYGDMRIKCNLTISFGQSSQNTQHYVTQVIILSQRPVNKANKSSAVLRLKDTQWEFDYVRSQPLLRDEFRFDPIMSFLDFYAYVIIGYDHDTYASEAGTPFFEKANDILNRAHGSMNAGSGWDISNTSGYSRSKLMEETLNPKFSEFRTAVYRYYYKGLDYLAQKPDKGGKTILSALKTIANVQQKLNAQSVIINLFFETKAPEIAETFKDSSDPGILNELTTVDPQHRETYEKAFKKQP